MDRRSAIVTTVGALGACLLGYVGRCFGWYWDNVLVPKPVSNYRILMHPGNVARYGEIPINPEFYATVFIDQDGVTSVESNGKSMSYDEWLKKELYVRSRAPGTKPLMIDLKITKGQYRIGT